MKKYNKVTQLSKRVEEIYVEFSFGCCGDPIEYIVIEL